VLESIADPTTRAALATALGKKDKVQVARTVGGADLGELAGLAVTLCELWGPVDDVLARTRTMSWPAPAARALDELEQAVAIARRLAPEAQFTADLGDVRGFEYYTGLRFAGYAQGAGDAVVRGGRYDELVARYGRPARAVGFAVDIEAIAQAQQAADVSTIAPTCGVLVVASDHDRAARIALALRATGVRAAVDLSGGHVGERRQYAGEVGLTHVLCLDDGQMHAVGGGDAVRVEAEAIEGLLHGDAAQLRALFR
jgi:ATP phosphoribosyltransferase regulatory subunit